MTTEKEQLEAEIAQRDARIAELEAHVTRLGRPYVEMRAQLEQEWCQVRAMSEALKNYQPRVGVVDERDEFEAWRADNFCGGIERLKKCSNAPDVYYYTAEQEAWRAWQARASLNPCRAQAVPDGYVLVPVEPTEIMQDAGCAVMPTVNCHPYDAGMVYKAMLAAVPSAHPEKD